MNKATIVGGVLTLLIVIIAVIAFWPTAPVVAPIAVTPIVSEPQTPARATSTQTIIGQSVDGRAIEAHTFGTGDVPVLFVGGIHGGYEANTVVLAEEIIDRLHADPTVIPADLTVHIIPNLNPDGYALPPSASDFDRRMNANGVDLNRNFNCRWSPNSSWRSAAVSGGTAAFSEPEAAALRDYVQVIQPVAAAFWHSRANAVYTSECGAGVLPLTDDVMNAYAAAADYTAAGLWTAYTVTGDVEGWLASIGIPAVTVELETRNDPETDRNWAGLLAMLQLLLESESGA